MLSTSSACAQLGAVPHTYSRTLPCVPALLACTASLLPPHRRSNYRLLLGYMCSSNRLVLPLLPYVACIRYHLDQGLGAALRLRGCPHLHRSRHCGAPPSNELSRSVARLRWAHRYRMGLANRSSRVSSGLRSSGRGICEEMPPWKTCDPGGATPAADGTGAAESALEQWAGRLRP